MRKPLEKPRYTHEQRIRAVKALYWEQNNVAKAVARFREWDPEGGKPHSYDQLYNMVKNWGKNFAERGHVWDKAPPGPPPPMPDNVAQCCLDLLLAGYKKGRAQRYYRSIRHALRKNADLAKLTHRYYKQEHAHRTLLRRLKHLDPTLHRHTLRYIRRLSPSTMTHRLAYCQALLAKGSEELPKYLARVVWLDAKLMHICPKDHEVYAPTEATTAGGLLVYDRRLPSTVYDVKKIMYYAAVNQVLGPCHFKICTGTTQYKQLCKDWPEEELRTYKVGGAWAPASKV
jgi:hypothetical protein